MTQLTKLNFSTEISLKDSLYSTAENQSVLKVLWARRVSLYSNLLRAGRSGVRIMVEARFSTAIQTGPGVHPVSCIIGTGGGIKAAGAWR
jgi:hypothetical protein